MPTDCDFPDCHEDAVALRLNCLLHEHVLVSFSYMNATEVADE